MKNSRKITKLQIENDVMEDFFLIGIVSSEPDYKLSLRLNKKLNISLKGRAPIRPEGLNEDSLFSRFTAQNASSNVIYNLFSNRSGNSYLLSKLRNIDYILQLVDIEDRVDVDELTAKLRETESVTAVFRISTDSLKDKNLEYLIQ